MDFWGVSSIDYTSNNCFAVKNDSMIRSCNRVYNAGSITAADVINMHAFFGEQLYTWVVDVADHATITILKEERLQYKISCSAMVLNLGNVSPLVDNVSITIKEVANEGEERTWVSIAAEGFNYSRAEFAKAIKNLKKRAAGAIKLYIGLWNEKAVATSMVIQHLNIVSIHKVATLPEYRGRGMGYMMMQKSLRDAQESGYQKAILLTTETNKSMYEKMGFQEYAIYEIYGN